MNAQLQPLDRDSQLPERIFKAEPGAFQADFNQRPFQFSHNLAGHPLFELPRLATLANRILGEKRKTKGVLWQNHDVPIDAKWSDIPQHKQQEKVAEAIANIDKSGSWVLLYSVQSDPEYSALLDRIIGEIEQMVGQRLQPDITIRDAYIFIASPQSVTPYHIDHETTFLFQIHGHRTAHLWERSVVPERELEDYYLGFLSAAKYKEENQSKAHTFDNVPGKGVHHPCCGPHAYRNGDTYSVALQINVFLRNLDVQSRIYQVNGMLRRLGIAPSVPGERPSRDQAKIRFMDLFSMRNPRTKMEILRSGLHRMAFPLLWAHHVKKMLRR